MEPRAAARREGSGTPTHETGGAGGVAEQDGQERRARAGGGRAAMRTARRIAGAYYPGALSPCCPCWGRVVVGSACVPWGGETCRLGTKVQGGIV